MDIRTLTGSSIPDALAEARSLWGENVVMLEAEPASGIRQARISVALPIPGAVHTAPEAQQAAPAEAAFFASSAPGLMRRRERQAGLYMSDRVRPATDVFTRIERQPAAIAGEEARIQRWEPAPLHADPVRAEPFRPEPPFPSADIMADEEDLPEPPVHAMPEPARTPVVDPAFSQLVRQGVRPSHARRICDAKPARGIRGLADALALRLPPALTGRAPARVAYIGDSGAGKTTLVLKSVLSRVRAGRRPPHVVVVAPGQENIRGWQDPTPMFESFDINVVRCGLEALPSALAGLNGDIVIDTPAGTSLPAELRLHVRLVVDARSTGSATAREGDGADSVVVTHLDGTRTLGYVAERLIAIGLPVAALARGGRAESGLEAYTPDRFAQSLCHA